MRVYLLDMTAIGRDDENTSSHRCSSSLSAGGYHKGVYTDRDQREAREIEVHVIIA